MPIIVSPPQNVPARRTPYRFGSIQNFLSTRPIDPHVWSPEEGVEWQSLVCPFPASGHTPELCPPEEGPLKSSPTRVVRPPETAFPRWFEVAVDCSVFPFSIPLDETAELNLRETVEFALETEIASLLALEATPLAAQPSILCAVSSAVQAAAEAQGDGRGLIHLPPGAASWLLSTSLLKEVGNRLQDSLGNVYVVNRALPDGTIYVEPSAGYEIWLSPVETLEIPQDLVASENTRVLRKESAYLLVRSSCGAFSVAYECG